jgi:hypothetical protein
MSTSGQPAAGKWGAVNYAGNENSRDTFIEKKTDHMKFFLEK